MRKKYRIKYRANNNAFSAITGIDAFELSGGQNCLVTKSVNLQKKAYELYTKTSNLGARIKISSVCGIQNCVKPEHLVATYKPTAKDAEYIKTYYKIDGAEHLAHAFKVPQNLMEEYIKTLQTPSH